MRVCSLALIALATTFPAAAFERSAEEMREQRQETIDRILHRNSPEDVAIDRNNCMAGQMPSITRMSRKKFKALTLLESSFNAQSAGRKIAAAAAGQGVSLPC